MKKIFYLFTTVLMLTSQQLSATYHDMEYWQGVHQKAIQGDNEAAYEMGVAWEEGNQGLKQNMYKSFLSHNCAYKKGNQKSLEKIMTHEENYWNMSFKAIGNTKMSGSSLICYGLYLYKGFAITNRKEMGKNINSARIFFEEPIKIEKKRQINSIETNPAQKKWIARGYMWLGIMLGKEEISLNDLEKSTWENLECGKESSSTEIAHVFLKKAVELGCYWAKQKLEIAKQQLEIERQVTEDN